MGGLTDGLDPEGQNKDRYPHEDVTVSEILPLGVFFIAFLAIFS